MKPVGMQACRDRLAAVPQISQVASDSDEDMQVTTPHTVAIHLSLRSHSTCFEESVQSDTIRAHALKRIYNTCLALKIIYNHMLQHVGWNADCSRMNFGLSDHGVTGDSVRPLTIVMNSGLTAVNDA